VIPLPAIRFAPKARPRSERNGMAGNEAGQMKEKNNVRHSKQYEEALVIGAAWSHSDGDGFNLKLDLLPNTPGRLVLRKPKSETAEHDEADFT
jgi:hypothetical protein